MNLRTITIATLTAGTLDIASALFLTAIEGKSGAKMLQGIASGPFGRWPFDHGLAGTLTGLAVHFCIMAVMVTAFATAARRAPLLVERPVAWGAAYGVLLYLFMYWIVIPLRWPPDSIVVTARAILVPIAIHVVLVGIPIGLIVAHFARRHAAAWGDEM